MPVTRQRRSALEEDMANFVTPRRSNRKRRPVEVFASFDLSMATEGNQERRSTDDLSDDDDDISLPPPKRRRVSVSDDDKAYTPSTKIHRPSAAAVPIVTPSRPTRNTEHSLGRIAVRFAKHVQVSTVSMQSATKRF